MLPKTSTSPHALLSFCVAAGHVEVAPGKAAAKGLAASCAKGLEVAKAMVAAVKCCMAAL
jgi:hypothetical protein